jgi:hypothetical protein
VFFNAIKKKNIALLNCPFIYKSQYKTFFCKICTSYITRVTQPMPRPSTLLTLTATGKQANEKSVNFNPDRLKQIYIAAEKMQSQQNEVSQFPAISLTTVSCDQLPQCGNLKQCPEQPHNPSNH